MMVPSALLRFALLAALPLTAAAADAPSTTHPPANPRVRAILADLGKVQSIGQVALSPDGRHLAWTMRPHESGAQHASMEIMVAGPRGENPQPVTAGKDCEASDPQWSPDSRELAYAGACGNAGQADIFVTTPGGKPRQLSHLKGEMTHPAWSPDGQRIGFLYVPGATRPAGALAAMKPPSGVIGVEGLEIQRVAVVTVPPDGSGQEAQPSNGAEDAGRPLGSRAIRSLVPLFNFVTPANLHVYEFDWSPDSQKLAYVAAPPPGENNWWVAQLYTGPATTDGAATSIVDPGKEAGALHGLQLAVPRWSPDGSQIAFIGGLMSDQGATGGDVYMVGANGGAAVDFTPNATATAAWLAWGQESKLIVSEVAGGASRISAYSFTFPPGFKAAHGTRVLTTNQMHRETLLEVPASIGDGRAAMSLSIANNGSFAVASSTFEKPPEVYLGALTPGSKLTQVTHANDALQPAWGKSESVEWTNDGFHIQGWLMLPKHYDPAKKYPLIVMVHGGPSSAVLPRWPNAGFGGAPMSAMDYFVLQPNPRGSYGQGERFTAANRKDFGYGDLRDILAGVDAVEKKYPSVDNSKLGLTGWSYGGFMTMFGVTQTQRFRAAVAGAGISDWQSYYGENSIDQWMLPFFGASVYDDPAVYAKSSAITFIHKIKTPTLVVVGDRDGECPAPQSFEFWHALKAEGVPTELVVYPDEGHGFRNPEHRVDVLERALNWFDQYLQ